MRVGTGTDEQAVRLGVLEVHSDLIRCVQRVVGLDAVNRHLAPQVVQQRRVVAGKVAAPARMGDEADGPAAVGASTTAAISFVAK